MSIIPGYLTAEEAAKVIGVDRSQITRYCKDPDPKYRLAGIKLGNQWLIKPADAKNFKPRPRGNPTFQKTA